MKFYVIAGEASGDLHAASLIVALKKLDSSAKFRVIGGEKMAETGAELVQHFKDRAFMGLYEVLKNLKTIKNHLNFAKLDALNWKPDAIILVDNPGFNMRLLKTFYSKQIPIYYYIAPKAWAWNEKRVVSLRKYCRLVLGILPFEEHFFKKHRVPYFYVGNPSKEQIEQFKIEHTHSGERNIIALLPGSRKQEIKKMLPLYLQIANQFPHEKFEIAEAPSAHLEWYSAIDNETNVQLNVNSFQLLIKSKAAIVTSGTATLETALFNVPQVVCYKTSALTAWIGKMVVKVRFISLVNLILNKKCVEELIQKQATVEKLKNELENLLYTSKSEQQKMEYQQMQSILGQSNASSKTAELIYQNLNQ